jgi:hypothetical protein
MSDMQAPTTKVTFQIFMVLAGPHLPSLKALVSTTPANKYVLAGHPPHKLNCSHKARHRIIFSYGQ